MLTGIIGMIATYYLFAYTLKDNRGSLKGTERSNSVGEGRRIYNYGINGRGERIPYDVSNRRGRRGRYHMMRGGLGCIECHGENGRGGRRINEDTSADIRWEELQKENFDFNKFKSAVTRGKENGDSLSEFMPRYDMTDSELNSIIKYLKTL